MRFWIIFLLSVSVAQFASGAAFDFKCEMIKDKVTRNSCIKDRVVKEQESNEVAAKKAAAIAEIDKAAVEQKRVEGFVKRAQELLTQDFKDPASAQFTEMKIIEAPFPALCGMVNGKNSYGGYVGSRPFYVQYIGSSAQKRIVELPKKAGERAIFDAEMDLLKLVCESGTPFP